MLTYDDRRSVAVQEQDWVRDLYMFEDVFLGSQIQQDVIRLSVQDVYSWYLACLSQEIGPSF
jgi:hypothetical protein